MAGGVIQSISAVHYGKKKGMGARHETCRDLLALQRS